MFHAIEVSLDKKPGVLRFDNVREFPLNALKDMQHDPVKGYTLTLQREGEEAEVICAYNSFCGDKNGLKALILIVIANTLRKDPRTFIANYLCYDTPRYDFIVGRGVRCRTIYIYQHGRYQEPLVTTQTGLGIYHDQNTIELLMLGDGNIIKFPLVPSINNWQDMKTTIATVNLMMNGLERDMLSTWR